MAHRELPMIEPVFAAYALAPIRVVTPLSGGRMARSWRVRAAEGEFVLRRAEPDLPGRLPLPRRQQLLRHLAQHLPEVPRLIANALGATLTEIDGERYELLPFIDGETLDEAAGVEALPVDTLAAAARLLARYHHAAARFPFTPEPGGEGFSAPGREVAARWERLRTRLSQEPASVLPELRGAAAERLAEWVRSLEEFWSPAAPPFLPSSLPSSSAPLPWLWAHGDFTPYNLVYRAGLPIGLLDFGAVQWAPAAYDVAVALLAFPGTERRAGVRALRRSGDERPTASDERPANETPKGLNARTPARLPPPLPTATFLDAYASERPLSEAELGAVPMLVRHRRVIAVLWIAEECLAGREELQGRLQDYLPETEETGPSLSSTPPEGNSDGHDQQPAR